MSRRHQEEVKAQLYQQMSTAVGPWYKILVISSFLDNIRSKWVVI